MRTIAFKGAGFLYVLLLLTISRTASAKIYLNSEPSKHFYAIGVAELAAIFDSTRSYTEVTGNGPIAPANTSEGSGGRFQFSPRDSRLGLGLETEESSGLRTRTYVEFDLAGYAPAPGAGNSEANFYQSGTARARVYYFTVEQNGWQFLAGHYWSLFGWGQDYVPSTVAVRPSTGAAYERQLQLQLLRNVGDSKGFSVQIAGSVARPAQRDSGLPTLETGLRLSYGSRIAPYTATTTGDVTAGGASLRVSTTTRQFTHPQASSPVSETHSIANAIAVDFRLPLLSVAPGEELGDTLVIVGEWTRGSGYGDEFNGWTGNVAPPSGSPGKPGVTADQPIIDAGLVGYDQRGNFTPIALNSWDLTLQYHAPASWHSWATLGLGELYSSNANNLLATAGKRTYNLAQEAFANVVRNFTREIRAGVETSVNRVRYDNQTWGVDRRIQFTTWYRF